MSQHTIDFFELCFLAEACIPPVPIARAYFWESLINSRYEAMTPAERKKMYDYMLRNPKFDITNSDCKLFAARYNPGNQFIISTKYKGKTGTTEAFLFEGKHHTNKTTHIHPEYIVSVTKKENK